MEILKELAMIIGSVLSALGGWELVKYLLNRKTNARLNDAQADESEVLSKTNVFLQEQLAKKEERFAEQTEIVRKLNAENIELTARVARLEAERSMKLCERRGCAQREPQSGY
jgi:hypothetical protein